MLSGGAPGERRCLDAYHGAAERATLKSHGAFSDQAEGRDVRRAPDCGPRGAGRKAKRRGHARAAPIRSEARVFPYSVSRRNSRASRNRFRKFARRSSSFLV
jgi:hypothetical protein